MLNTAYCQYSFLNLGDKPVFCPISLYQAHSHRGSSVCLWHLVARGATNHPAVHGQAPHEEVSAVLGVRPAAVEASFREQFLHL